MGIKQQAEKVRLSLKDYPNVKVVAATKYMDVEQTRQLVEAGVLELGENRVDTFLEKYEQLKDYPITWHFFGTLQSRKVRDICNKIKCLHSLDKTALAIELNKRLEDTLDCFVQVNMSEDPTKSGVPLNKVKSFIKSLEKYPKIRVIGLMCIGPLTYDNEVLKEIFLKMKKMQEEIEELYLDYAPCTELSMGMSNDYLVAVKCGATYLRLGRIFLKQ